MDGVGGVGRTPKPWGNPVVGFVLGACVGFATYWSGALVVAAPDLVALPPHALPTQFARPVTTFTAWEVALALAGAVVGATVSRWRWRFVGLLSYVGLVSLIVGYLTYTITVSIPSVPPGERWLSYVLLAAEGGGLCLIVASSFYALDTTTRRRWNRVAHTRRYDPDHRPGVAVVVPTFNEPFEMVEETVRRLVGQHYPPSQLTVVVADDSTDATTSRRLAALCAELGAVHSTRPDRRGYKAGALNHALARLPPSVEFLSVVDADYWVDPDYVRTVVGHFVDPRLSFVQTPQDYRNVDESFLTRQYKRAEAFFYHGIMPSRNEHGSIIFCGTMGMLRRSALEAVGGFAEDHICEDAELSVRLAAAGWDSLYLDQSFGRGLMPAVFEAYKKQFHRWAFGNVRILFTRSWLIVRSRMGLRRKVDFLSSNLHWFDGFFLTAIAAVLLVMGLGQAFGYDAVTYHQRELILLALVPAFLVVDGVMLLHMVLRPAGGISLGQTLLVQGMWYSIKFTNMVAATKCMLGFRSAFVRTPKTPGGRMGRVRSLARAWWVTRMESLLGGLLAATAAYNAYLASLGPLTYGAVLLPLWLALYALMFLCAPIYAYLSYRTLAPTSHAAPTAPARRARHAVTARPASSPKR